MPSFRLICLAFCTSLLAASSVASVNLARVLTDPTPEEIWHNSMDRGLGLSYGYGDASGYRLYTTPGHWAGVNPYPQSRCEAILDEDSNPSEGFHDFSAIKANGFNHIRIPIDPESLLMLERPTGNAPAMLAVPSAAQGVIDALRQDVQQAYAEGLITIIDFHPGPVAQGQWNNFYNSMVSDISGQRPPPDPAISTVAYNGVPRDPYNYTGTFKWHFLTNTTNSAGQYPLEEFWTSFMELFDPTEDPIGCPVVYELMNEPYDNVYDNEVDPPSIFSLDGAGGFVRTDPSPVSDWINTWRPQWRNIMKRCIQKLHGPERYFLVTKATSGASNFATDEEMLPFNSGDVDNSVGVGNLDQIGYVCHFYDPFSFTNTSTDASVNHSYENPRDFYSPPGNATPYPADEAPMSEKFALVSQWRERMKAKLSELGYDIPLHLVFTEFGCRRGDRVLSQGGYGQGGLGRSAPWTTVTPSDDGPLESYPFGVRLPSAQWVYDARMGIEALPAGWTYYAGQGSFGFFNGSIDSASWGGHGDWQDANGQLSAALFLEETP